MLLKVPSMALKIMQFKFLTEKGMLLIANVLVTVFSCTADAVI